MKSSRYVVLGAGLMGAATAWQLASRGEEVTVVERDVPGSARGSSHGSARIFRYAYPDPAYVRMVVHAEALWEQLGRSSGRRLLQRVGCLDHGPARDPATLARVLDRVRVEHSLYPAQRARELWPQFDFTTSVLHQPGAGVLDPRSTIEAALDLAVAAGARVLENWPVASLRRKGAGVILYGPDGATSAGTAEPETTEPETIEAEHVIVTAGGWLPELLGDLDLPGDFVRKLPRFTVMQENAYHFPYRDGQQPWPAVIHMDRMQIYALPGGRDAGFTGQKIAEFNGGLPMRSASEQTGLIDAANRSRVVAYVRENLPGLVPEPYAETTCLFTNTPDEHFVLDRAGAVTIASPCSGHGAKFAPLIGSMAADLATGGSVAESVPAFFRPSLSR
ncbi:FAD-dependent oxidoreductase [Kocuria coralli]|uniref:FAD-dependent oxidoreductase n=1 Tax=Kocuria coralli TaxID=1461025 RepID=A0A5J5KUQ0_9MICC|nr:FAD-dependent oxidoreductase [Kocuria coralli]KAA9393242.1 FAD-dependent oxidoreductase [Kocuria coralli]